MIYDWSNALASWLSRQRYVRDSDNLGDGSATGAAACIAPGPQLCILNPFTMMSAPKCNVSATRVYSSPCQGFRVNCSSKNKVSLYNLPLFVYSEPVYCETCAEIKHHNYMCVFVFLSGFRSKPLRYEWRFLFTLHHCLSPSKFGHNPMERRLEEGPVSDMVHLSDAS